MLKYHPFVRYPKYFGILLALFSLWALKDLPNLSFSRNLESLLSVDAHQYQSYEKLKGLLDDQEVWVLTMETPDGLFTPQGITALHEVSERLASHEEVIDIKSLTHSVRPIRQGFSLEMVPMASIDQLEPKALQALKTYALSNPLMRQVMVSKNGKDALITLTLDHRKARKGASLDLRKLQQELAPWTAQGFVFRYLGLALAAEEMKRSLARDLRIMLPILSFWILGLLIWFKPNLRFLIYLCLQTLFTTSLGVLWFGQQEAGLSVETFLLLPIWAVIQWMALLHIVAACDEAGKEGAPHPIALGIQRIFVPSMLVCLTTMAGFLSLRSSDLRWVQEAGSMGCIGVWMIYLATFGPGLAWLSILYTPDSRQGPAEQCKALPLIPRLSLYLGIERRRILLALGFGSLIGLTGLGHWVIDIDIKAFLARHMETRKALEYFDSVYGGANLAQLTIDTGSAGGIQDRVFLERLWELTATINQHSEVTAAYSYPQIIAIMNEAWEGSEKGSLKLPESDFLLASFSSLLNAKGFPFMEALKDPEARETYLLIRTADQPTKDYVALIEQMKDLAHSSLPNHCLISAEDALDSIKMADARISRSIYDSMIGCAFMLFFLLATLWRSPWLAGTVVVTNGLFILVVIGSSTWLGIPINSLSCFLGAVAFGIAIDDGIHLTGYFRQLLKEQVPSQTAIKKAVQAKWRPMLFTSLLLAGTFLSTALIASIPVVQLFAWLGMACFLAGLAVNLWIVPALLSEWWGRQKKEST